MRSPLRRPLPLLIAAAMLFGCDSPSGPGNVPAEIVVVSGDLQTAVVGTDPGAALVVRVTNSRGRPVRGHPVQFVVTAGAGTVAPGSVETDADGVAQARWTLGTVAGDTQRVEARAAGAVVAAFRAVATAGPAAALQKVSGDAQSAFPGSRLADSLVVRVVDAHGNPVSGALVDWVAVTDGAGTVTPPTQATGANGRSAAAWTLGQHGTHRVRATSGTLPFVEFTARAGSVGAIDITVRLPQPNGVVADSVLVAADVVSSAASINSFTARIADRVVSLTPVGSESQGTLVLTGLPQGNYDLVVRATAVNGDSGVVVVPVRYDRPPAVALNLPPAGQVARPGLRIDADCVDTVGCASMRAQAVDLAVPFQSRVPVTIATGTTGIHTTANLSALDGKRLLVTICATDSAGQERCTEVAPVYVEASGGAWAALDSAGADVFDLDAGRLLFADADSAVFMMDRGTRAVTLLDSAIIGVDGRLFSAGAIYRGLFVGISEWRLTTQGLGGQAASLRVAGEWAAWWSTTYNLGTLRDLFLRNLTTGTTTQIATGVAAAHAQPDVAANGDAVYSNSAHIWRYRAGAATQITFSASPTVDREPVTDGINVVYRRHQGSTAPATEIAFTGPAVDSILVTGHPGAVPREDYAAAGGWIAFTKPDAGGALQVYTRAPDGTVRQATSFFASSRIRALSPDGHVVFASGGRVFVRRAPYGSAAVEVGGDRTSARWDWRGTQLVVFLGRSAFSVSY